MDRWQLNFVYAKKSAFLNCGFAFHGFISNPVHIKPRLLLVEFNSSL